GELRAHLSDGPMTAVCLWVLSSAVALVLYSYLGYPLLLMLVAPFRRKQAPTVAFVAWPSISIVLPVYNEEAVIRRRLENLLALDYPPDRPQMLGGSDASTDGTVGIVSEFAGRGVELLRLPHRRGKTAAENLARPLLRGDIIVHTDASVPGERSSLKRLVASFADPPVGVPWSHNVSVAR